MAGPTKKSLDLERTMIQEAGQIDSALMDSLRRISEIDLAASQLPVPEAPNPFAAGLLGGLRGMAAFIAGGPGAVSQVSSQIQQQRLADQRERAAIQAQNLQQQGFARLNELNRQKMMASIEEERARNKKQLATTLAEIKDRERRDAESRAHDLKLQDRADARAESSRRPKDPKFAGLSDYALNSVMAISGGRVMKQDALGNVVPADPESPDEFLRFIKETRIALNDAASNGQISAKSLEEHSETLDDAMADAQSRLDNQGGGDGADSGPESAVPPRPGQVGGRLLSPSEGLPFHEAIQQLRDVIDLRDDELVQDQGPEIRESDIRSPIPNFGQGVTDTDVLGFLRFQDAKSQVID
jgi:hypothetical protein